MNDSQNQGWLEPALQREYDEEQCRLCREPSGTGIGLCNRCLRELAQERMEKREHPDLHP